MAKKNSPVDNDAADLSRCPECNNTVSADELAVFDGLCEDCYNLRSAGEGREADDSFFINQKMQENENLY